MPSLHSIQRERQAQEVLELRQEAKGQVDVATPDRLMRGVLDPGLRIRVAGGASLGTLPLAKENSESIRQGFGEAPPEEGIGERIQRATEYWGVKWAAEALRLVRHCESSGVVHPCKVGASGERGPFQFMSGTWASTPYAHLDPCDLEAATFAAAWMVSQGRQYEFSCWPRGGAR